MRIPRFTGAVYSGGFFAVDRSEWDPATLRERRYDVAKTLQAFEAADASQRRAMRDFLRREIRCLVPGAAERPPRALS